MRLLGVKAPRHETLLALILILAAGRALALGQNQGLSSWLKPNAGPSTLIPDLQKDDSLRLSWLPGVGSYRANRIVAERPFLQLPLTPERLALVAWVGETTALEVQRWYQRQAQVP